MHFIVCQLSCIGEATKCDRKNTGCRIRWLFIQLLACTWINLFLFWSGFFLICIRQSSVVWYSLSSFYSNDAYFYHILTFFQEYYLWEIISRTPLLLNSVFKLYVIYWILLLNRQREDITWILSFMVTKW